MVSDLGASSTEVTLDEVAAQRAAALAMMAEADEMVLNSVRAAEDATRAIEVSEGEGG